MHSDNQPSQRDFIYAVKAFAILSVICAHTSSVSNASGADNIFAGNVLNSLGSVGVAIFFMISGFLFSRGSHDFAGFFRKRVATLVIPWVVTGTAVYCYVAIRKQGIDIAGWLGFVMGHHSYLYFLSMLMVCYLVAFGIDKKPLRLSIVMGLSLASILLTASGVVTQINPYMNPFNWLFYFGLGCLLFDLGGLSSLMLFAKKTVHLWVAVFLCCLVVFSLDGSVGYWTSEYLFFEAISVACISGLCMSPMIYQSSTVIAIGKESFSIYLLHMPFAGVIAHVFNMVDSALLTLTRPFVVLAITIACIHFCKYISSEIKLARHLPVLIGLRG